MQIVICGGGGFIGQRLARLLLDKGYEVIILDRNQSRVSSPKLQSFFADLLNPKLFEKRWFSGAEAVINLSGKDILTQSIRRQYGKAVSPQISISSILLLLWIMYSHNQNRLAEWHG
jgi:nucleoside-diphosphate-sugar epimerase